MHILPSPRCDLNHFAIAENHSHNVPSRELPSYGCAHHVMLPAPDKCVSDAYCTSDYVITCANYDRLLSLRKPGAGRNPLSIDANL